MNKTHNINLGGYPFTIDEDAYSALEKYLDKIESHFRGSEGFEEIYEDIENRMAELLQERTRTKMIVTVDDVQHAVAILGLPEEFGTEAYDRGSDKHREYKTGKKLYRDPDDKVIGGVCGGLAAYFGVQDAVWLRVAFALLSIGGGVGVIAYILFWALVPVAQSPADFLAMRGEPINVKNIAKIVEDEVENISDHFSELSEDWKTKRRKKKRKKRSSRKSWKDHL